MTKRIITIDIETLPVDKPFESKLFWETEEEFRKTACDANLGRILCIGYSEQNEFGAITEHGCFGWREVTKDFEPDERIILAEFWQYLSGFDTERDLMIGHNIMDFDLPFIMESRKKWVIRTFGANCCLQTDFGSSSIVSDLIFKPDAKL